VVVGRKGSHRGGRSTAAKSATERWSTGVRSDGCRSRHSGRRATGDDGEACGTLGWARGGWSTLVDDELAGEEAGCYSRRLELVLGAG
jgi:hypothetical protein